MKVVNTGNRYMMYDDSLRTFDKIPAGTYTLCCEKFTGFFLKSKQDMEVKEKIYGQHLDKISKVMSSFGRFDRNMGVILSGNKGIGKSLFAKMLSEECVKSDIPVIIVDSFMPGIAAYIDSIDQEVMILFDEFDKTFAKGMGDGEDPQAMMLSLFDGMSMGKKMFVVTCNNLNRLNDFLVNRPGRFHYHFRFGYPTAQEIRTYMKDKIPEEMYDQIDEVVTFSRKVDLNYDCLRAIAFELCGGQKFSEAIKDLNILNINEERYSACLCFATGEKLYSYGSEGIDMFTPDNREAFDLYGDKDGNNYICEVCFCVNDCAYDQRTNTMIVSPDNVNIAWNERDDETTKNFVSHFKETKIAYLALTRRATQQDIHYTV